MGDKPQRKSIDTKFAGYHFRSRLEARWAVFFEELGIQWRYEPEGFKLLNGDYYLPDFYLPNSDLWLEIKPVERSVTTWPEHPAFHHFSDDSPFDNFYLIKGRPYIELIEFAGEIFLDEDSNQGYMAWPGYDVGHFFCECPECGAIGIEFETRANRIACDCMDNENSFLNPATDRLLRAYDAAIEARFEHHEADDYAVRKG